MMYQRYFCNGSGHTPRQLGLFSYCFVSLHGRLPAGCKQRSVGRSVGHRRPQINPPLSLGMAQGDSVGRHADLFPPALCPFRGPIQGGISHPIDNVASVSCRSSTYNQGLILPSSRFLFSLSVSPCLIIIIHGGYAL